VRKFSAIFLATLALAFACRAEADYYVVVNERNPTTSLTQQQALQVFMGRSRFFPGGKPAVPCEVGSDQLREGFYQALSGLSLPQVTSYWARLMFSGRNLPPQRLDDEDAVAEKVAGDPAAIGWLTRPPTRKGLRTVLVLKGTP
jgi:hypothetical protein